MTAGVVVVGGGFAALEVALALKKSRAGIPVTVISNETYVTYRPWLIHLPAGGPEPPVIPFARLLETAGINIVPGRASSADPKARHVLLDSGRRIEYDQLVVASGASADRERVPGAPEHALFPCDVADARLLAARVSSGGAQVAIVFGWERPGPGLEYAAWIAARYPRVRVTAIDGDGTMMRRFGSQATAWVRSLLERRGARLITDGPVERIGEGSIAVADTEVAAEICAVVAPLRGNTSWLPPDLLDGRGMLRVDQRLVAATGVIGIGDVLAVPHGYRLPPTLRSIRATAPAVARNVGAALRGADPEPVLKLGQPDMMLPDLAGTALLVRNRRRLLSGRLPLLLRSLSDRRYLRARNSQRPSSDAHPAAASAGAGDA